MAAYTAGFMTHVICRLTAKNRDQLRIPIRSVIEYGLPLPFLERMVACSWGDSDVDSTGYAYLHVHAGRQVRFICS